jgi:prephenate dehydrogenase
VTGNDANPTHARRALDLGAIDAIGEDPLAEIAFVATPPGAVPGVVRDLVEAQRAKGDAGVPGLAITDVAGVKTPIVESIGAVQGFVGGHPMAGSEQLGIDGADPDLFEGATWVLTPTAKTEPSAYSRVQSVVSLLGAEVLALTPSQHDSLVAVVSHVPHLTATALMNLASRTAKEHAALLRLAAGGFRDMTRVAAGDPSIWPEICGENAAAIVDTLDSLVAELSGLRNRIAGGDRSRLLDALTSASQARRALPVRAVRPVELAEVSLPVPDRPGVLAEITTLAGDLAVNILDLEIAHSAEGDRGVLVLVVGADEAERLRAGIAARGYRPRTRPLE